MTRQEQAILVAYCNISLALVALPLISLYTFQKLGNLGDPKYFLFETLEGQAFMCFLIKLLFFVLLNLLLSYILKVGATLQLYGKLKFWFVVESILFLILLFQFAVELPVDVLVIITYLVMLTYKFACLSIVHSFMDEVWESDFLHFDQVTHQMYLDDNVVHLSHLKNLISEKQSECK